MKCKNCNSELILRKTCNENRYECPNNDCPILFGRKIRGTDNKDTEVEWVLEARVREEPL